jgi:hypothetical protein
VAVAAIESDVDWGIRLLSRLPHDCGDPTSRVAPRNWAVRQRGPDRVTPTINTLDVEVCASRTAGSDFDCLMAALVELTGVQIGEKVHYPGVNGIISERCLADARSDNNACDCSIWTSARKCKFTHRSPSRLQADAKLRDASTLICRFSSKAATLNRPEGRYKCPAPSARRGLLRSSSGLESSGGRRDQKASRSMRSTKSTG